MGIDPDPLEAAKLFRDLADDKHPYAQVLYQFFIPFFCDLFQTFHTYVTPIRFQTIPRHSIPNHTIRDQLIPYHNPPHYTIPHHAITHHTISKLPPPPPPI